MTLRLIEIVLSDNDAKKIQELLKEYPIIEHSQIRLPDEKMLIRILLEAQQSEAILDLLESQCAGWKGSRALMLPVQATLPRSEPEITTKPQIEKKSPEHIDREELYESIKDAAQCTRVYFIMVVLSTIVASIGLRHNNVTVIIGAMVIAPLLGPNMALALGTTLGDLLLLRRSLITSLAGIATSVVLSIIMGALLHVDLAVAGAVLKTQVSLGDIVVALASGCAGALAFTTGIPAILIGVMVAVSLLPPVVTFGLLLGSGQPTLALGSLLLFLLNLICVNLSATITFLAQGIKPTSWWEKDRAKKATRIAIGFWVALLIALIGLILLLPKGLV